MLDGVATTCSTSLEKRLFQTRLVLDGMFGHLVLRIDRPADGVAVTHFVGKPRSHRRAARQATAGLLGRGRHCRAWKEAQWSPFAVGSRVKLARPATLADADRLDGEPLLGPAHEAVVGVLLGRYQAGAFTQRPPASNTCTIPLITGWPSAPRHAPCLASGFSRSDCPRSTRTRPTARSYNCRVRITPEAGNPVYGIRAQAALVKDFKHISDVGDAGEPERASW